MKAAATVRYLLITCADPADGQFRGVHQACGLLAGTGTVRHLVWQGDRRATAPRGPLRWAVVSGHGCADEARVGDGAHAALRPADLPPLKGADLYLLACYQGREAIRQQWGEATGATVHGCAGETESALSTLFLLALLEHGPESAFHWFDRWRIANDRLRPRFAEMRRLYDERGRDFAAAIGAIAEVADLGPFGDILEVSRRHAGALSGLGSPV